MRHRPVPRLNLAHRQTALMVASFFLLGLAAGLEAILLAG